MKLIIDNYFFAKCWTVHIEWSSLLVKFHPATPSNKCNLPKRPPTLHTIPVSTPPSYFWLIKLGKHIITGELMLVACTLRHNSSDSQDFWPLSSLTGVFHLLQLFRLLFKDASIFSKRLRCHEVQIEWGKSIFFLEFCHAKVHFARFLISDWNFESTEAFNLKGLIICF